MNTVCNFFIKLCFRSVNSFLYPKELAISRIELGCDCSVREGPHSHKHNEMVTKDPFIVLTILHRSCSH